MDVQDRLQRLADALPENGSVILTRADLLEMAAARDGSRDTEELAADCTVPQVAEMFKRSPQTVRDWIKSGKLRAYLFSGREYRVTRAAVEEFIEQQRNGKGLAVQKGTTDLGAWRRTSAADAG